MVGVEPFLDDHCVDWEFAFDGISKFFLFDFEAATAPVLEFHDAVAGASTQDWDECQKDTSVDVD